MSEAGEAFEAIVGLVIAGIVLLAIAGPLSSMTGINLAFWGRAMIVLALVLAGIIVAAVVGSIFGR